MQPRVVLAAFAGDEVSHFTLSQEPQMARDITAVLIATQRWETAVAVQDKVFPAALRTAIQVGVCLSVQPSGSLFLVLRPEVLLPLEFLSCSGAVFSFVGRRLLPSDEAFGRTGLCSS